MAKITVQNTDINIVKYNDEDYISLTDMARSQLQEHIIFRWLSLKSTIEYLGEWEILYNTDFNCTEFGTIKNAAGSNNFVLSVKTCHDYATINKLICLSNMENLNAVFIEQSIPQSERIVKLNQIAIHQMKILESGDNIDKRLLKYD